jgi:hypothetical protein
MSEAQIELRCPQALRVRTCRHRREWAMMKPANSNSVAQSRKTWLELKGDVSFDGSEKLLCPKIRSNEKQCEQVERNAQS